MKKSIIAVLTFVMITSMSIMSFAAPQYSGTPDGTVLSFGGYTSMTIPASEADAGFSVDILIAIPEDCTTVEAAQAEVICDEGVELVGLDRTESIDGTATSAAAADNVVVFAVSGAGMSAASFADVNYRLATVNLKRVAGATSANLSFWAEDDGGASVVAYNEFAGYLSSSDMFATLAITFTEDSAGGDETFEITNKVVEKADSYTGKIKVEENGAIVEKDVTAVAGKVYAVFSKNISKENALAAGTYGIIVNGVKFPGQMDVPAGSAFVIKLVDGYGAEAKLSGNFSATAYTADGETEAVTFTAN